MNAILRLTDFGQSCWLDNLTRGKISDGELARRVAREGVCGVTSNPSIFSKAISKGNDYDEQIRMLAGQGRSILEIYEALVVKDIQDACDVLQPVYSRSDGADGFISLEVSPYLAHDAEGTLAEARRLFAAVHRPNCLIKIPGTPACLPVIEQCLYEGVNVNITLLFSIASYEAVAHACLRALERRAAEGKPVRYVASVASFFLSRIDTLVDQLLGHRIVPAGGAAAALLPQQLFGKAAVASAKLAYQSFKRIFNGARWGALAAAGARVQRPLWASTSTKDPLYDDTYYVAPLIGAHTINTMPEETIAAFADHGVCERPTIEEGVDQAQQALAALQQVGVDLDFATRQLVDEGIQKFIDPFDKLLAVLAEKRVQFLAERTGTQKISPATSGAEVSATLGSLTGKQFVRRLSARDPYLWAADPSRAASIGNRLGWLDCAEQFGKQTDAIKGFAVQVKDSGIQHVVLAGMGGSSLCPEVCQSTFGPQPGWPVLTVLDNTDPAALRRVKLRAELERALFLIASKSGTTTETESFYRFFYEQMKKSAGADRAAAHFVAITDPGTPLTVEAAQKGFLRTFENPADIGGRYSALSYFGLVPMALIGIDIEKILDSARRMALRCGPGVPADSNPAVILGASLAVNRHQGRDKVTLVLSESVRSLGSWIEQLLAESTGKCATGLIPIDAEDPGPPEAYGRDRLFVHVFLASDNTKKAGTRLAALEAAGHPVISIEMKDRHDLGGEFLRWELATAVAGAIMGVNPFDEPNVSESKNNTRALLAEWTRNGFLDEGDPLFEGGDLRIFADQSVVPDAAGYGSMEALLAAFLGSARAADYLAFLAYFAPTPARDKKLASMRAMLRNRLRLPVTTGYGPRYLHSTGQLHKGGPDSGLFVMLTAGAGRDLPIPGEKHGFAVLQRAQALGDYRALAGKRRRVIRIHLGASVDKGLRRLLEIGDATLFSRKIG